MRQPDEAGFTLVETLIAIVVMSAAVITIVSALAGLTLSNQAHRGHAVVETAVRSFAQAAQARVDSGTSLQAAVSKTDTSLIVADSSELPGAGGYVAVDLETVQIVSVSGNTLTVNRGRNDPTTATTHAATAFVLPVRRCPTAADLQPPASSYTLPAGVTISVSAVEHWNGSDFTSAADCPSAYDAACTYDDGSGPLEPDIRQDCFGGLYRLTLTVSTASEPSLRGVDTTTKILLRRGAAS